MQGMRWIVFSMVIMLAGAVALAIGVSTGRIGPHACLESGTMDLTAEGTPSGTAWDGNMLRLTLPRADGSIMLLSIDTCKGKVVSRLNVRLALPPPAAAAHS